MTSLNATNAPLTLSAVGRLFRGDQTACRVSYSAAAMGSVGRVAGIGDGSSGASISRSELSLELGLPDRLLAICVLALAFLVCACFLGPPFFVEITTWG